MPTQIVMMKPTKYVVGLLACSLIVVSAQDLQRPQFHVMPEKNWMNDPNGPFYDPMHGYYHLFFQYNPYGAVWGNMSWGHAISRDLVRWQPLPVALYPDNSYDIDGVFSGSVSLVAGSPQITYTCVGPQGQLQCLAYPRNRADPMLIEWVKDDSNPIIATQPQGTINDNFRDDTTAWFDADAQVWLMAVGNERTGNDGVVLLYESKDFKQWQYSNDLFVLPQGGMIECPDFFPVTGSPGLYCLKMSDGPDSFFLGTYNTTSRTFLPTTPRTLYDYGQGYASKSFYDPIGKRQILWTWVAEEDNGAPRGWQGVQSLPRVMTYDATQNSLLISPLPELRQLRNASLAKLGPRMLAPGTFASMSGANGLMLEVDAYFSAPLANMDAITTFGVALRVSPDYSIQTRITAQLTPGQVDFNNTDMPGLDLYVFAMNASAPEQTNVQQCENACQSNDSCVAWVYVRPGDGDCRCCLKSALPMPAANQFCVSGVKKTAATIFVDRTQSGTDGSTSMQGGTIPVTIDASGNATVRLHVFSDHSMLETFVNGGLARVTSRIYPSDPSATGVAIFASGTSVNLVNATVWSVGTIW